MAPFGFGRLWEIIRWSGCIESQTPSRQRSIIHMLYHYWRIASKRLSHIAMQQLQISRLAWRQWVWGTSLRDSWSIMRSLFGAEILHSEAWRAGMTYLLSIEACSTVPKNWKTSNVIMFISAGGLHFPTSSICCHPNDFSWESLRIILYCCQIMSSPEGKYRKYDGGRT